MLRFIATIVLFFQYLKSRIKKEIIVGVMIRVRSNGDPRWFPNDKYQLDYYISLSPPPSTDSEQTETFDDYGYPDSDVYHYARNIRDVVGVMWHLDDETWHVRSANLNTALVLAD